MIEDILHTKKLERQRYEKDIVRGIATLDAMKPSCGENPPRVKKLPEQCASIFPEITLSSVPFPGHRMPINMHPFEELIPTGISLPARRQNADLIARIAQRAGFFPDAAVERYRKILDNNQYFSFCQGIHFHSHS